MYKRWNWLATQSLPKSAPVEKRWADSIYREICNHSREQLEQNRPELCDEGRTEQSNLAKHWSVSLDWKVQHSRGWQWQEWNVPALGTPVAGKERPGPIRRPNETTWTYRRYGLYLSQGQWTWVCRGSDEELWVEMTSKQPLLDTGMGLLAARRSRCDSSLVRGSRPTSRGSSRGRIRGDEEDAIDNKLQVSTATQGIGGRKIRACGGSRGDGRSVGEEGKQAKAPSETQCRFTHGGL